MARGNMGSQERKAQRAKAGAIVKNCGEGVGAGVLMSVPEAHLLCASWAEVSAGCGMGRGGKDLRLGLQTLSRA